MKKKIMFLLTGLFLCLMLLPARTYATTTIEKLDINFTSPQLGKSPDYHPTVKALSPTAAKPTVKKVTWEYFDWDGENGAYKTVTKFEKGIEYRLTMLIDPGSGYKFPNNPYICLCGIDTIEDGMTRWEVLPSSDKYSGMLKVSIGNLFVHKWSYQFTNLTDSTITCKIKSSVTVPLTLLCDGKLVEDPEHYTWDPDVLDEYRFCETKVTLSDPSAYSVKVCGSYGNRYLKITSLTTDLSDVALTITTAVGEHDNWEDSDRYIDNYTKILKIKPAYATAAPYLAKCSVSYANKAFAVTLTNASTHRIYVKSGTFKVTNTKASSKYLKVKNSMNVTIKPGATKTINYKIVSGTYSKTYKKYYRLDTKWKWHEKDRSIRLMLNGSKVQYLKDGSWKTLYKK